MICQDLMKSDVKCISPVTTLEEAAVRMRDDGIGINGAQVDRCEALHDLTHHIGNRLEAHPERCFIGDARAIGDSDYSGSIRRDAGDRDRDGLGMEREQSQAERQQGETQHPAGVLPAISGLHLYSSHQMNVTVELYSALL